MLYTSTENKRIKEIKKLNKKKYRDLENLYLIEGEHLVKEAYKSTFVDSDNFIVDIHYSEEMERAWSELKADPRVTTTMDLYHLGLIFVDSHYLKRHYKIRI